MSVVYTFPNVFQHKDGPLREYVLMFVFYPYLYDVSVVHISKVKCVRVILPLAILLVLVAADAVVLILYKHDLYLVCVCAVSQVNNTVCFY